MKKIIVASSIAIASLGLVACSSNASPTPTVTITQNAPAPTQGDPVVPDTSMSNENLYLLGLRSMGNRIIDNASDGELLEVGYSVCDAIDAGYSVEDIIAFLAVEMAKDGTTSDTYVEAVGYIIGAADTALCPSATF